MPMGFFFEIKRRAGQIIGPVASITMVVYFAYHAIQGDRGFIALGKLEHQVSSLNSDLIDLNNKRIRLEKRVALLRPDSIDPDMLEERARIVLGYAWADEIILLEAKPDARAELALGQITLNPKGERKPAIPALHQGNKP